MLNETTVERIRAEAAELKPLRTLLLLLAGLFFAIGWVAARTLGVLWSGCTWAYAAVVVGWKSAKGRP